MRSKFVRAALVWGAGALALSMPLLLGHSLNAHGDGYTLVFIGLNLVPVLVVEWLSGQEVTHHVLWTGAASVVFWAGVGIVVAARPSRSSKRAGTRA